MIFLDSDAIIAFLRGQPAMAAFLAEHKTETFVIPAPVNVRDLLWILLSALGKGISKQ